MGFSMNYALLRKIPRYVCKLFLFFWRTQDNECCLFREAHATYRHQKINGLQCAPDCKFLEKIYLPHSLEKARTKAYFFSDKIKSLALELQSS